MDGRRNFLKTAFATCSLLAGSKLLTACTPIKKVATDEETFETFATPDALKGMPIKATFLDEISWDIPHQNWGTKEWDQDFKAMKKMGINTVVLIRAGLAKWIASPFQCLLGKEDVYYPPVDLVEMFLTLADKYNMAFYFGMYDSGKYWQEGLFQKEIDLNMALIDEVWKKYGHHKSFQGWYLSQEISRRTKNMSKIYAEVGKHAKAVSGNLSTMVSPYIHGVKTDQVMAGDKALSVKEHEEEWDEILNNVNGAVDIMAFQDGQVDYHELYDYLVINKKLADKYNLTLLPEIHASYGEKNYEQIAGKGYMTYDFFLPGLIIDALESGDGKHLFDWAKELIEKDIHTVNMLGCHDGIPLLDLKGLLSEERIQNLIDTVVGRGGYVKDLHGQKNMYYQVNATYYSALGEDDAKMLLARALQLFMPGKPQIWYLDLFAGKNDHEAVKRAGAGGHKEINRTNLTTEQMEEALKKPVVARQLELLRFRSTCPAFEKESRIMVNSDGNKMEFTWENDGYQAKLKADLKTFEFVITETAPDGQTRTL